MENSQLLELIGKTETENLKSDITKQYTENFHKRFPEWFEENKHMAKAFSLVTVTKEKEIKSIGMSCINDLLNDNFGQFLKGIIGLQSFTATILDGGAKSFNTLSGNAGYNMANIGIAMGSYIQVGSGNSPATRQDFNIENPFGTSPESLLSGIIGLSGWNSGLGLISMIRSFNAGGSGAISETILVQAWRATDSNHRQAVYSRDNISPVANFIIGETVNVNYNLVLS